MDRIKEIELRKAKIVEESATAEGEALNSLTAEIDSLNAELAELRSKESDVEKRKKIAEQINNNEIKSNKIEIEKRGNEKMNENILDSVEYRKAFMEFARTGVMSEEFRSVALTGENQAVIPLTTLNVIVEKLESYGNIIPLVTKMNYPSGVAIPTSQLASAAVFTNDVDLANTGAKVDNKVTGNVTFSAYPLVKAIGLSFMSQVQTLSAFEASLANNVASAMAKAIENAIINGSGNGAPTGILKSTPAKNVSLSATPSFKDIIAIKKAIPSAYRSGSVIVMNDSTFYDFVGITDAQGQPVGRVNFGIDNTANYMLFGTPVVVTDFIKDNDSAGAGETIAFVCQLDKYVINNAHEVDLVTYVEQATRNKVYQSFAALDGKLVDANGLVFINKAGASASK